MILLCAILLTIGVADAIVTVPLVHRPTKLQEFRKVSAKHANRAASGYSLPMMDKLDQEYYAEVQIGTPPQTFMLLVETGSDYFWVPSVRCTNYDISLGAGNYYDNSLSSTWHSCPEMGRFSSRNFYNGTYAKDTVIMGDFTIENQIIGEVMERMAEPFTNVPFDGMLGLSPFSFDNEAKNPIANLFAQGKIKHNIFGIYLVGSEDNGSSLTLGGTEKSLYTGDFSYVPMSIYYSMGLTTMWVAIGDDVKVSDISTNYCGSTGCLSVFDTGTFGVAFGPTAEGGRGDMVMDLLGWVKPNCSNADSMPIVSLTMNGMDFPIGPEFYIIRGISPTTGESECQQIVDALDEGAPDDGFKSIAVGDVFFRKYYSVWDHDRARVGFATAKIPDDLGKPMDDVLDPVLESPTDSMQTDTEMLFM